MEGLKADRIEIRAKDGAAIRAELYKDYVKNTKGAVVVSHGFGEHLRAYRRFANRLAEAGYAVFVFDQHGHGDLPSLKMRGIIPSYQNFLDDLHSVSSEARLRFPGIPVALFGHSMGGNIVANYLLSRGQAGYSCAVLESPWFGLYKNYSPITVGLAWVLGRLSPKIATVNKLSASDLTGDAARAGEYKKDVLYHNRISMRMFSGINKGCADALQGAGSIKIPLFIAAAAHDRVVSNEAIARFVSAAGPNVTSKEYDCCHAIHNDTQSEALYRDTISFFDKHVGTDRETEIC